MLLLQPVVDHIIKVFALALIEAEHKRNIGRDRSQASSLSEVPKLMMRESSSLYWSVNAFTNACRIRRRMAAWNGNAVQLSAERHFF